VGFVLSRTIGIFGFIEYGLRPAPQTLVSILVEIDPLGLLALERPHRAITQPGLSPRRQKRCDPEAASLGAQRSVQVPSHIRLLTRHEER